MKKEKKPLALKRLFMDNKSYWPGFCWLILLSLSSGFFKSGAASFFGSTVDSGMAGATSAAVSAALLTLLMVGADALRLAAFNRETGRISERMFLDTKKRLFDRIARCKLSAMGMSSGDILSRASSDLPQLSHFVSNSFSWLISVFFRGIVALAFCLTVSWQLSLVYIILLPVLFFIMNKIGTPIQALQRQAASRSGSAYSVMREMLANNAVIKAYSAEGYLDSRFDKEVDAGRAALDRSAVKGTLLFLTAYLYDAALIAIVFLYGGYLLASGQLTVGQFVTFVTLSGSVREAFDLMERGMSTFRMAEAMAGRVYEVLDIPVEKADIGSAKPDFTAETVVELENLSFGYSSEKLVLDNISLTVKRGQKLGIIGPSGCGKSTLVNLICGLYSGYEGGMRLFGQDAGELGLQQIRGAIAMVSQNPCLFRGSIADNVRCGCLDASDAQVEKALKGARLWDFVSGLEDGADTDIGDAGSRLSGGQRQRIAIARALCRDAELVILDEAASALDTATEREIQETMAEAFADKTVLVIAHRFSSLSNTDSVCCLEKGRIAEYGTIAELMSRDSRLRRMAQSQPAEPALPGKEEPHE